jgi:hypothetical protein
MSTLMIRFFKNLFFFCLSFFLLFSCAGCGPSWGFQKGISHCFNDNSGRIFLPPTGPTSGLSMEIVRGSYGVRMYVNVLQLEAPLDPSSPEVTPVVLSIYGNVVVVMADRFQGGQRLLLPEDITDELIDVLLSNQSFLVYVGCYEAEIVPTGFCEAYKKIMSIPIN